MNQIATITNAVINGEYEKVSELVNKDQSLVDSFSEDGWTPLHLAAYFGHIEIASLLLEKGATLHVKEKNRNGNTPLQAAVANKKISLVEFLIDRGANINVTQSGGWTSLHEATLLGDEELVKLLIEKGADISIKRDDGKTAFDIALEKEHQHLLHLVQN
ncbi:ankyrin repeat domain-containing protein [Bacillus sp. DX1.1]|uniref:ankyrin repeat domain-containing protein n=1 Tax=unclassified Bacillus (in: firmicutes) TaxID=185979 RepID=UPI00256FCBED|nr:MULTISPECIES: ankyrin repeat domain-containing protein [unclassified Bacillus (in: firmicutes)]MDM5155210.1 ankyrin repeat domain-containing protein [Bacillus sp. DX1.1]WJE84095.1 ankyrin repeat domain-containing protein [Bacillus sp. DX3.1]